MTATDWAGWIGAAAWIPPIAAWIHRAVVKPLVLIVPDGRAEVGFTTFGPLFNLRMAFSSTRKDVLLARLVLTLHHEQGEKHLFTWTGMEESLGEVSDLAGNRQFLKKEQSAIALRLPTDALVERFVRFQDDTFRQGFPTVGNSFGAQVQFLRESGRDYRAEALKSKEFLDVLAFLRSSCWWKAGRYRVEFDAWARHNTEFENWEFAFSLSQDDVDALRRNVELVQKEMENLLNQGAEGFSPHAIAWSWRNVALVDT